MVTVAVVLLSGMAVAQAGERFERDHVLVPFAPAAMVEGPAALRYNAAAIGTQRGWAFTYYHTYTNSSFEGDDALYFASDRVGASVERLGSGPDVLDGRAYTLGLSTGRDKPVMLGGSYQWRSSDDPKQDGSHFWAYSLLWRPNDWLSLAAVADNHNRMKIDGQRSDAEYVYSAAVSLFDGRLKVGSDWRQLTSQRVKDGTYHLAAAFEMMDGLALYADIDEDENYFLGGRVNLTSLFVGSHAEFNSHSDYQGGVFYVGMHQERHRPITTIRREVVHLRLSGAIPDRKPPRLLLGPNPATTLDWVTLLRRAETDPAVRAVVITIDDPQLGWGRLDELRRAMGRLRAAGKYTVVYLDGMIGNGEYYLATAADLIVVPPVSTINFLGLRAEVTFARRLLDKLGVKADLEHIGDYKTASDLLTRTSMSPAHREALGRLLDDFDRQVREEVAASRHVDAAAVASWIDHGPWVSVDACEAGLIDQVGYADELDALVRAHVGWVSGNVDGQALARRKYHRRQWGRPPRVAVVFAEGSIADGTDRDEWLTGHVMGAESVSQAIRNARQDRGVKAIVLRVNSGGGSMFASDQIRRAVAETAGKKPIVVSFADVAASGGYYIACAADSVYALPNTVTGSIGIIHGKLDLSGLYDKIGLDREVATRGRYADLYGTSHSFDDDERAVVRDQMQRGYDRFVGVVADGRDLSADSVDAIGRGRVWSGSAARDLGLIDGYADLRTAITTAARMAGISSGREVAVEVLPKAGWKLFDSGLFFPGILTGSGSLAGWARSALGHAGPADSEGPACELPYVLTIE